MSATPSPDSPLLLAWVKYNPDDAFPGAEWDADAPCGTALVGFPEDGRRDGEINHITRCRVCTAKFGPTPTVKSAADCPLCGTSDCGDCRD